MSITSDREIEAKYRLLAPEVADRYATVSALSTGFKAGAATARIYLDVYYDTAAFDLIRHGLGLRVRQGEREIRISAKTLDTRQISGVHHRVELEDIVAPGFTRPPYLDQCSEALQRLVHECNPRGKKLRPVLNLYQTRMKRPVFHGDGDAQALAELSVDAVRVLSSLPPEVGAPESNTIAEFRELELELLPDGDYDSLRLLAKRLARRSGLRVSRASKLETGLTELSRFSGDIARPDIRPELHMAEACRLIWRQQLMQIVLLEHGVRLGEDPEYVHDMRVAIRRARTAYELFGPFFRKRDVAPFIADLRNLGRRLGRVRDLDVALINLTTFHRETSKSRQADVRKLEDHVRNQLEPARAELLKRLDSPEHATFVSDFMKFTQSPGKGVKKSLADAYMPQPVQVRHRMPLSILERFERVRAYERLFESDDGVSTDQLHALRIECKYLRYVLEFSKHLLGEEGELLIQQLKLMQDQLGDLNDCSVETARLRKQDSLAVDESIVQQRLQHLAETSAKLEAAFPETFWRFVAHENRRLLGEAIAHI